MLGVSGMLGNSGDAAAAAEPRESGGNGEAGGGGGGVGPSSGGFSEEDKSRIEEAEERNSGGNRWPRQETLALLQIRSDMDVAFRDSSLKGPLWEEVSRKLAELGYHRNAKKCKEKFENVYKYHRRTKEGRSTKPDGKTYRFFDQLEALENLAPPLPPPQPPRPQPQPQPQSHPAAAAVAMPVVVGTTNPPIVLPPQHTVPSTTPILKPIIVSQNNINPINPPPPNQFPPPPPLVSQQVISANPISFSYQAAVPPSRHKMPVDLGSISTSSSTSSDEEPEKRRKRKRKWGDFFQRLMSEVIQKQEEMQRKFLDALEKRERERVAREEAWRAQEITRMNQEHDLLVHERSVAAAKDAAVIQFLQKVSDQQIPNAPQIQMQMQTHENNPPPPPPPPPQVQLQTPSKSMEIQRADNGGGDNNFVPTSSSRWPKAEVEALIRLRTNMDLKYQENGPKGPLWEEISAAMRKIGYDRSSKRCKEKWENINKYFKKVKESNKKRPEDSKTCPYFQQLDALYKEKAKGENVNPSATFNPMVPMMVQPEQQYRPADDERENVERNIEDDDEGEDDQDEDDDDDEDVGGYEIVTNKGASAGTVE